MRSIGAENDEFSQNIVRKALRKLLSEFSDPEVAYWIKTAPYEEIDSVIKKVREKKMFSDYDEADFGRDPTGRMTKEDWDIKEPIDKPSYTRDEGATNWDAIHKEPRYADWRGKVLRNLFRDEITKRELTIGHDAYQKNLSDFKNTANRAATDDLESPPIMDEPEVPNNYGTADTAAAAADADTLTIINDLTFGEATTPDDIAGLIMDAKRLRDEPGTSKQQVTEIRKYIAKLTQMQNVIKKTQDQLKLDKKTQSSIEGAGNCMLEDDVPL